MGEFGSLALHHSWPLWERGAHFDLGHVLSSAVTDAVTPKEVGRLGVHHAGLWECALADSRLTWSGGVYDVFGLERGSVITREQALAHYSEESRVKLEALRGYAIRHKRGFTLDVDIHAAAVGERRRMRIVAAPVCEGSAVVRLQGVKVII
jgi:hypothetical protein